MQLGTADLLGSISFPSISGDSSAGVLLSFGSFTAADITSVSWALDPSTDDVVAIDLSALRGDAGCNIGSNCSNSTLDLFLIVAQPGGTSCSFSDGFGSCSGFATVTEIEYVPATAVPELSTRAMGCVGIAGFGFAGYRASRRTAAAV